MKPAPVLNVKVSKDLALELLNLLESITTLPFFVVQLPLAVHCCHVIPGWVSVVWVPTSWPWATARRDDATVRRRYMMIPERFPMSRTADGTRGNDSFYNVPNGVL